MPTKTDHQIIDQRSLALHGAVAEKIRLNPALLDIARSNLRRWTEHSGLMPDAWREWQNLIDTLPIDRLLELLTDPGPQAVRLRQSSPFGGILSDQERGEIFKRYESRAA